MQTTTPTISQDPMQTINSRRARHKKNLKELERKESEFENSKVDIKPRLIGVVRKRERFIDDGSKSGEDSNDSRIKVKDLSLSRSGGKSQTTLNGKKSLSRQSPLPPPPPSHPLPSSHPLTDRTTRSKQRIGQPDSHLLNSSKSNNSSQLKSTLPQTKSKLKSTTPAPSSAPSSSDYRSNVVNTASPKRKTSISPVKKSADLKPSSSTPSSISISGPPKKRKSKSLPDHHPFCDRCGGKENQRPRGDADLVEESGPFVRCEKCAITYHSRCLPSSAIKAMKKQKRNNEIPTFVCSMCEREEELKCGLCGELHTPNQTNSEMVAAELFEGKEENTQQIESNVIEKNDTKEENEFISDFNQFTEKIKQSETTIANDDNIDVVNSVTVSHDEDQTQLDSSVPSSSTTLPHSSSLLSKELPPQSPPSSSSPLPSQVSSPPPPLFRCFRCFLAVHVDCLVKEFDRCRQEGELMNLEEDTEIEESGIKEWFLNHWKCVDCLRWDRSVETILTYRDEMKPNSSETVREYLIKFEGYSHRHDTWVPERWLKNLKAHRSLLSNFLKRTIEDNELAISKGHKSPWPLSYEEALEPEWLRIDKILDIERYPDSMDIEESPRSVLIKWQNLQHEFSTWEEWPEPTHPDYNQFQDAFKKFLERRRKLIADHTELRKMMARHEKNSSTNSHSHTHSHSLHGNYHSSNHGKFVELEKQPDYLVNGELKNYQLDGLNWLLFQSHIGKSCILADEMGLGKTVQIVALISAIYHTRHLFPHLIIIPTSTVSHWQREFAKWAPDLEVVFYGGMKSSRELIQQKEIFITDSLNSRRTTRKEEKIIGCHVILASYECFTIDAAVFKNIKFHHLVVDEGHRLKNDSGQLFQLLKKMIQVEHRILLTGTPLQNNVRELFNLMNFLVKIYLSSLSPSPFFFLSSTA